MVSFRDLLNRPDGQEWPQIAINYNVLQQYGAVKKLDDNHPVAQWKDESWGNFYDEKDNWIEFSDYFDFFIYQEESNKMYIFDEYRYALRQIVKAFEKKAGGVLLGGHPGIGKSSLLPAVLRYFLYHKRCIIYHHSVTYLFAPEGVYEITSKDVSMFNHKSYKGMFALIDSGDDQGLPPPYLVDNRSRLFVVHAASPHPNCFSAWLKHKRGYMVIMNPPSFDQAYSMILGYAERETVEPLKDTLKLVFEEYNPSVRVLLYYMLEDLVEGAKLLSEFIDNVGKYVAAITPDKLDHLIREGPESLVSSSDASGITHSLVTTFRDIVIPDDDYQEIITTTSSLKVAYSVGWTRRMVHQITSHSIWRLIIRVYRKRDLETRGKLHDLLHSSTRLAASLGWLFEILAFDLLSAGGPFDLRPVDGPDMLTIELAMKIINIFDAKSKANTTYSDNFHVPSQPNNATWDAFCFIPDEATRFGGKVGIGFQMTVGRQHSAKPEGLRVLYNRMKDAGAQVFWFVFVIPKGKDFKHPEFSDRRFRVFILEVDFRYLNYDMTQFSRYNELEKKHEEVYEMDIDSAI